MLANKNKDQQKNHLSRVPFAKPTFTVGDIKRAIPPHCFRRSLVRSSSYVAYDIAIIFLFYYLATNYFHRLPSPFSYLIWPTYWMVQGCVLTGVWVIAMSVVTMRLAITNGSMTHPIFTSRERLQIWISDVGIIVVSYILYRMVLSKSLIWLACIYGVPLLIVNGFLVTITYLQHTHPSLPHYDDSEWDWLRGALATVDRDYGVLNRVFHNITDTHVVHHLFSTMPHYHAMEATKEVKPLLGEYYQFDYTPFYMAMWREAKECLYVEADEKKGGLFWYKNKY
ncbi:Fatty acid desaturase, type 1 [Cynara cardunculus var. scolymus]|uniref:Fatty acid desaturase, type 1 n=1 Tax=Cynara cardunculus var. scolymus TaxID=59895 RepID=A0A118JTW1_CYNCS|nr:Fatty acid desaturase, type 1 [Cynara cardunculus var. scolymus]